MFVEKFCSEDKSPRGGDAEAISGPPTEEVEEQTAWAVFAAYKFASSWNFPMFFLYRIRLLPNQFET